MSLLVGREAADAGCLSETGVRVVGGAVCCLRSFYLDFQVFLCLRRFSGGIRASTVVLCATWAKMMLVKLLLLGEEGTKFLRCGNLLAGGRS